MITLQVLFCPDCSAERPFEGPCCGDGHGPDCVELCCVECGLAVLIAGLVEEDHQVLATVADLRVGRAA